MSSLCLSLYRYIFDTDMIDVSIQSGQSMTALEIRHLFAPVQKLFLHVFNIRPYIYIYVCVCVCVCVQQVNKYTGARMFLHE